MPEPLMEGYKELWGCVLSMAINDALCEFPSSKEMLRAKRDAIAWLDSPGEDFALVCTFAGLDPVAVYQAWKGKRIRRVSQMHLAGARPEPTRRVRSTPPPTGPGQSNGTDEEIRAKAREVLSDSWMTKDELRAVLRVGRRRTQEVVDHFGDALEKRRGLGSRIEYSLPAYREAAE